MWPMAKERVTLRPRCKEQVMSATIEKFGASIVKCLIVHGPPIILEGRPAHAQSPHIKHNPGVNCLGTWLLAKATPELSLHQSEAFEYHGWIGDII